MSLTPPTRPGPTRRVLWALVLLVLLGHLLLWWASSAPLEVRLARSEHADPLKMRVIPAPAEPEVAPPREPARVAAAPRTARPVAAPTPTASDMPTPPPELAAAPPASEASAASEAAVAANAFAASEPAVNASATLAQASSATAAKPASSAAAPAASTPDVTAWPLISLGALPPSTLVSYHLSGMDKGLSYHASGELRWQHNDAAYELTLSVRAFLLGSRHWRSIGRIEATGLVPLKFSDSWRNERAAHFDREQQRIVFSSNSQPAALQQGAQDQVSLYVQLAAAMAGEPERFAPGTRLQVQTATVRDAQPWALTLEGTETLTLEGRPIPVSKWVCQPRNQYEARVEFWVAAQQAWLPVRIRISQTNGSYIDLQWRSSEPLAPLAPRA